MKMEKEHGKTGRKPTHRQMQRRALSIMLTMVMVLSAIMCAGISVQAESATTTLTFSDDEIAETVSGTGYSIDTASAPVLTIEKAGVYKIKGSCENGSIVVKGSLSSVVLILSDLTLTSTTTAPVVIKKNSTVTIHLDGTNTLNDEENAANETSTDETISGAFEGAAVKVKSGSDIVICGDGTLNVNGCKNGIKGAESSSVTVNSGTINVGSSDSPIPNNGIAADGSVIINGGQVNIYSDNDAVKSVPDTGDETSAGTVTINGGTFNINAGGDGIQAANDLTINNGTFDIKTVDGYNGTGTKWYYINKNGNNDNNVSQWKSTGDTESHKGIKVSGTSSDDTTVETDTSGETCTLNINGGTFKLNTADDAIHSDAYATIKGGTFTITSGDDGMHADTSLVIGDRDDYTNGKHERDPQITIEQCYEGLEGGTVYVYSGKSYIVGLDDGINAAAGSGSSDDGFNPGGGPGNNRPGAPGNPGGNTGGSSSAGSDYAIYVYGGDIYINVEGDGIDSNGDIYFYGGNTEVWGMKANGDNEPIDSDGSIIITNATIFAGGGRGMSYVDEEASTSQKNISSKNTTYSNGTKIYVKNGNDTVYSVTVPKQVSYLYYTSPSATSSYSFSTSGTASCSTGNAWSHETYSSEVELAATEDATGIMKYTCSACGDTEYKTIPITTTITCDGHENSSGEQGGDDEEDEGYTATFTADDGVEGIDVYYTQDYTGADETDVTSTVSRDSGTGNPDSTGSGQVNFLIRLKNGYSIAATPVVTGDYKNIKGKDGTGVDNLFRVTKVNSTLNITITTIQCSHDNLDTTTGNWTWNNGYSSATLSFTCNDCGSTVDYTGNITSKLNSDNKIEFKATYTDSSNNVYTDAQIADPFTAIFSVDHATVNIYYTQDYTLTDVLGTLSAVARDGESGNPVRKDGQINFEVVPDTGYEISTVTATNGTYKNIKGPEDTGKVNTYRLTKITDNLTITITTKSSDDNTETGTGTTDSDSDTNADTAAGTKTTTDTAADTTTGSESSSDQGASSDDSSGTNAGETSSTYAARLAQKGEDGTALGKGASAEAAEAAITSLTSDSDPKGSEFGVLCARAVKTTKNTVKLKWNKASGAVKYVIYTNKCGRKNVCTKVAETAKNNYNYKKLKKGTYYKFIIVALDSDNNVVSTSKVVHAATTGGKVGNCKKVTTKGGTKLTVKVGKTYKLNGKAVKGTLKIKKHRTAVCYESSNTAVAKVTSKGVIKGVKKGTCYIYAYAQNGSYKKIKVTIK